MEAATGDTGGSGGVGGGVGGGSGVIVKACVLSLLALKPRAGV
jgi:hypothetical protein